MMSACTHIRVHLGAYSDGELGAADRVRVAEHLATCRACDEALADIRGVGELLRSQVAPPPSSGEFSGLAAGVLSRLGAEELQSWRALFQRATGDWHWALVGAGAVCATLVLVLVVSAICEVSPNRHREDSLAALLANFEAPEGRLLILATPVGRDEAPMLMQFGSAENDSDREGPMTLPAGFSGPSGEDLTLALSDAVVRPDGRVGDLRSMSAPDRLHTEAILDDLQRLRGVPFVSFLGQRVSVQKLGFVTNTHVTGKAL